jgi:ribosomal protein L19
MNDLMKSVEEPVNPNIPQLHPGDMVNVHIRIKEGNTERIQEFHGTVIRSEHVATMPLHRSAYRQQWHRRQRTFSPALPPGK